MTDSMSDTAERGLEVAAGILKLVAERDSALKGERSANDDWMDASARHAKRVTEVEKMLNDEYERAEKLEAAMLALVHAVERYAPNKHPQCLSDALIRCREESGMGDRERTSAAEEASDAATKC